MLPDTLKKLRNREVLNLWDQKAKLFIKIQINKKEKVICWQRFVSKDRRNWTEWNPYLNLKDINGIINNLLSQK